ncbi:MAG TPA: S53 family peptidase [Ktedonobacteraceae bacterium]|nr:S53 family peptidase [Ktedonobacteraceae bacterium]
MQRQCKSILWFSVQCALTLAVIGFLVSSCSLTGSSASTTVQSTPTKSAKSTVPPQSSTPVAGKPTGATKLANGKPLPTDEIKPLTFNLVYNDAAMAQDVAQMYTPGSATYHQFLTPDQIVQKYAPGNAQVQQVESWLQQNGYTIVSIDPMRSSIKVQATVATIQSSLHIKFNVYTVLGREVFIQDGVPTLSGTVSSLVSSVVGLDNFAFPTIKPAFSTTGATLPGSGNCKAYGAQHSLTRNNLAGAYQISQLYQQGLQGQGMTIGVAEFGEPYSVQDVTNYAACVGLPTPNIQNINVDGTVAAGSGQGEAAMDLELIAGLAPKAQILDYQANINNTSFAQALVDVFNRVASDDKVQVLSVSYGEYEDAFSGSEQAAVNRSLRTLAAEGISVFVSSGDCGAYSERIKNIAVVSFPASAPYAIAVGGTHLQVGSNNTRTSETTWGQDSLFPLCDNNWGSGGGVSQNSAFKRPSWQVGPGTTNHYDGSSGLVFSSLFGFTPVKAPNGLRQVPDVSAAAYPNIAIYYQGAWLAAGGTSAAAPIWAAGALLVDQGLKQQNKPLLGSVPEMYTLANHPGSFHPFTDITSGNNLFYPATRGWDYATGWGSPNFNDILRLELSL